MIEASSLPLSETTTGQLRAEFLELYARGERIRERLDEIAKRSAEFDVVLTEPENPAEETAS